MTKGQMTGKAGKQGGVVTGAKRGMCAERGVAHCAVERSIRRGQNIILGFNSGQVFGNLDKSQFNKAMKADALE